MFQWRLYPSIFTAPKYTILNVLTCHDRKAYNKTPCSRNVGNTNLMLEKHGMMDIMEFKSRKENDEDVSMRAMLDCVLSSSN